MSALGQKQTCAVQNGMSALTQKRTFPPHSGRCHQYGGGLRCRCIFAASTHHGRSSAKRGNARSSALPPSPIGSPHRRVCPIGPTAIVLEITTIPISESMPCQAVRPARRTNVLPNSSRSRRDARTIPRENDRSGSSVRAGRPNCTRRSRTQTHPHRRSCRPNAPSGSGASPFGYSLYIRSSIGRLIAFASISSTSSPRRRNRSTRSPLAGCPSDRSDRSRKK